MPDVTAIGEVLIDFACKEMDEAGYPLMKANPGGAPGNFLAALSAYGCSTAMLGKVGADQFGKLLVSSLEKAGIDTSGVVIDANVFTTLAFVTLDANGNREFSFARKPGADTCLGYDELKLSLVDECKVFHFGTLSLTHEPARSTTKSAVAYAKEQGKWISFDPNLRKPLWEDLDKAREAMLWGLAQADVVKIAKEEVEFLWGDMEVSDAAVKLLEEYQVTIAFITLGEKGCYYAAKVGCGYVTSIKVHPVDTTGAGDIFGGSALSRLLKTGKELKDITKEELLHATQFACTAASLSTEQYGGMCAVVALSDVEKKLSV